MFEERFEDSQISQESDDIIIVEPLSQEQQNKNMLETQKITGTIKQSNQSSYQNSVIRQPQNQSYQPYKPNQSIYQTQQRSQAPQAVNLAKSFQQSTYNPPPQQNKRETVSPQPQVKIDRTTVMPKQDNTPIERTTFGKSQQVVIEYEEPKQSVKPQANNPTRLSQKSIDKYVKPTDKMTQSERKTQEQQQKQVLLQIDMMQCKLGFQDYKGKEIIEMFNIKDKILSINPEISKVMCQYSDICIVTFLSKNNEIVNQISKAKFPSELGCFVYIKVESNQKDLMYIYYNGDDEQLIEILILISSIFVIQSKNDLQIKPFRCLDLLMKKLQNNQTLQQIVPLFLWLQQDQMNLQPFKILEDQVIQSNLPGVLEIIKQKDAIAIGAQGSPDYNKCIKNLGEILAKTIMSKNIFGINLNGALLYCYSDYLMQLINSNQKLQPEHMWTSITEEYTKFIYNISLHLYHNEIENILKKNKPKLSNDLFRDVINLRDQALVQSYQQANLFNKNQHYQSFKLKLIEVINQKEKVFISYQENLSLLENEAIIQGCFKGVNGKNVDKFINDFNSALKQYDQKQFELESTGAIVDFIHDHYEQYLKEMQGDYNKYNQAQESSAANEAQLEAEIKQLELRAANLKKELETQEKKNKLLKQQNEDLKEEFKLEQENIKAGNEQEINPKRDELVFQAKQNLIEKNKEFNFLRQQIAKKQTEQNNEGGGCLIF
ncbi:hypothetical protein pb186bvf_019551 [Paramecium bursaria]